MGSFEALRARFPITESRIYLNAAAVGPLPRPAIEAMAAHAESIATRGEGAVQTWMNLKESCRVNVSALLGVPARALTFCSHTSHGMGLLALAFGEAFEKRKLLHPAGEFPSSTMPFAHRGFALEAIEAVEGVYRAEDFAARTSDDTLAWVVSHVQFGDGSRIDLDAFCAAAKEKGVLLVLNATQSAGTEPIEAGRRGVSALVASGHKWLCSGFGNGVLYVAPELWERLRPPFVGWTSTVGSATLDLADTRLREDISVLETGCHQLAGLAALDKTSEMLLEVGLAEVREALVELGEALQDGLEAKGYTLATPRASAHHAATTTFLHPQPEMLVEELAQQNIDVSARAGGVRVSPHVYNNLDDIDAFLDAF